MNATPTLLPPSTRVINVAAHAGQRVPQTQHHKPVMEQAAPAQIRIATAVVETAIAHLRHRVTVTQIVQIRVSVSSQVDGGGTIASEQPLLGASAASAVEALREAHTAATVHGWGCRGVSNAATFRAAAIELGDLLTAAQFSAIGVEA